MTPQTTRLFTTKIVDLNQGSPMDTSRQDNPDAVPKASVVETLRWAAARCDDAITSFIPPGRPGHFKLPGLECIAAGVLIALAGAILARFFGSQAAASIATFGAGVTILGCLLSHPRASEIVMTFIGSPVARELRDMAALGQARIYVAKGQDGSVQSVERRRVRSLRSERIGRYRHIHLEIEGEESPLTVRHLAPKSADFLERSLASH